MPFVFAVAGLLFMIVAINGTQSQLFALLRKEFVGSNSFVPWASSIIVLGLIGYAKPAKPIADAMIGLVLLVIILGNKGGFFAQFNAALRNPAAPSVPAPAPSSPDSVFNNPATPEFGYGSVTAPNGGTYAIPPAQTTYAPGAF